MTIYIYIYIYISGVSSVRNFYGRGFGPITCTGSESTLLSCSSQAITTHFCDHGAAAVVCVLRE